MEETKQEAWGRLSETTKKTSFSLKDWSSGILK